MSVSMTRVCWFGFGLVVLVLSVTGTLHADVINGAPVPEIDGSSLSAALGILSAGVLLLRARRSK